LHESTIGTGDIPAMIGMQAMLQPVMEEEHEVTVVICADAA
jgi:hypothetical protein